MKKIIFAILGFVLLSVIAFQVLYFFEGKKETEVTEIKSAEIPVAIPIISKEEIPENKKYLKEEFKKCFKRNIESESFETILAAIKRQRSFSEPIVTSENYELLTSDQKEVVVQFIPQEEERNRVRVFKINPVDGFPDRIKDFPNSESSIEKRLVGALSLGQQQSKTVSTTQNSYDGSLLALDITNGRLVRIHLSAGSIDFECKNQSCICLSKEK
jgi:hypothetical protein